MELSASGAKGSLQSLCLAVDEAVYLGQIVAALVAESIHAAQAALDRTIVRYEVRESTASARAAIEEDVPVVQLGWTTNVLMRDRIRAGHADAAFASVAFIIKANNHWLIDQRTHGDSLLPYATYMDQFCGEWFATGLSLLHLRRSFPLEVDDGLERLARLSGDSPYRLAGRRCEATSRQSPHRRSAASRS